MTPGEADNKSFPFEIDTGSEKLLFNASCAETRSKCVEIFSLAAKTASWDEIQAAQLKQIEKNSTAASSPSSTAQADELERLSNERKQLEEKNQRLLDERKALEKERLQVKQEKFEMERKVMLEAKNKKEKEKIQFLRQGMALPQNGYLQSHNGAYYALMQADGNFVVYVSHHAVPANAIWSTNTCSNEDEGPYCLTLSDDGRLSLLDVTCTERWSSTSNGLGVPDFCLKLEDDGNLVLRDGNSHIVWQSSTSRGDSNLLLPI
eukprot:CAMPEP_0173146562 /NCGR_PEP_ID=MMETSP1105-20130129/8566_1 /TAXON_ID=2985 /ORGANISM="Ochromonas sp., Strain BG-1" /LENGTH=262 /DNA_ID=CAMNT_0014060785 /DNA_START=217 /DNA_END=1005 /DNA_ORIENTATION=-